MTISQLSLGLLPIHPFHFLQWFVCWQCYAFELKNSKRNVSRNLDASAMTICLLCNLSENKFELLKDRKINVLLCFAFILEVLLLCIGICSHEMS